MIGYYAHHHGSGHVQRAMAIAEELDDEVVILSSAARPASWAGGWVDLPLDTDIAPVDADAGGAFHWTPVGSAGLAKRMSRISEWITATKPRVVVVDVSVEVATLVRLHGVRVVVVAQPGRRTDAAHTLAYRLADAVIGGWPDWARCIEMADPSRVQAVGGLSRLAITGERNRSSAIAVFTGTGTRGPSALDAVIANARPQLDDREWITLSARPSHEVTEVLQNSAFVFAHCGQNVVAEIAAARIPAILVAEERPFEEQVFTARSLAASDLPVRVVSPGDAIDWPRLLAGIGPGGRWSEWVDGGAARRTADIIGRVATERVHA